MLKWKRFILVAAVLLAGISSLNAAYYHVTPDGAGAKDGAAWASAMGLTEFKTSVEGTPVAGDVYFIKEGTYTLAAAIDASTKAGTGVAPISLVGVKSATTNEGANIVVSDIAVFGNLPLVQCGTTYTFKTGQYWRVQGISFEGETANFFTAAANTIIDRCKFNNTYQTNSTRFALSTGNAAFIINCEFVSAKNNGITPSLGSVVLNCYFHGFTNTSSNAFVCGSTGIVIEDCIFENCAGTAILKGSTAGGLIRNNTFRKVGTAISGSTANSYGCINNIFDSCSVAAVKHTTQEDFAYFYGNHGDNIRCTDMWQLVDTISIFKDPSVTTGDPKFVNLTSDLSLATTSPCLNSGLGNSFLISTATTPSKGAWRPTIDEAARNTNPGVSHVDSGTVYKILNATLTGTLVAATSIANDSLICWLNSLWGYSSFNRATGIRTYGLDTIAIDTTISYTDSIVKKPTRLIRPRTGSSKAAALDSLASQSGMWGWKYSKSDSTQHFKNSTGYKFTNKGSISGAATIRSGR